MWNLFIGLATLMAVSAGIGAAVGMARWRFAATARKWLTLYLIGSAAFQSIQLVAAVCGKNRGAIGTLWTSWAAVTLIPALIQWTPPRTKRLLQGGQWAFIAIWAIYFITRGTLNTSDRAPQAFLAIALFYLSLLSILHGLGSEDSSTLWIGAGIIAPQTVDMFFFTGEAGLIPWSIKAGWTAWLVRDVAWIYAHLCFLRVLRCPSPKSSSSFS